jgi:hypothetical protein
MNKFLTILGFLFLFGCSSNNIPNIKSFYNDKNAVFLSCIGQDIKFLGGKTTNDFESLWTNIVLSGNLLIVPKYGEYKLKDSIDNRKLWWISGARSHKDGWAELNADTGKFTATNKTRQFQANCTKKSKKIELD